MNAKAKILYDQNIDDFGHLDPDQIMGLTIYGEARSESREGRVAVGTVILERVDKQGWMGKTIEEVCFMPYQFSCFLPGDPNRDMLKRTADNWNAYYRGSRPLMECYAVARGLIEGTIARDPDLASVHCCQYVTSKYRTDTDAKWNAETNPVKKDRTDAGRWWARMKRFRIIGAHEFYV